MEPNFFELTQNNTIIELVMEDLRDRAAYGMATYGVPLLQDDTKKDALKEAYEEALDLCVYLRLELERRNSGEPDSVPPGV